MNPFAELDHLKECLDQHRPLDRAIVRNLHEDLVLRWTYHSNAIEGNTLTLLETKVVLEGITVGGKSLREHLEAVNHKAAIHFLEDLLRSDSPFTEWSIKALHQLILKGIDDENAGRYRSMNVQISGASHLPPDHLQVAGLMERFVEWRNGDAASLHPVERAARVHSDFVRIHPFVDGNGRTSRLLMNLELMQSGFPPAVIPVERRLAYYQALDDYHAKGDRAPFISLVAGVVKDGFGPYFHALGISAP